MRLEFCSILAPLCEWSRVSCLRPAPWDSAVCWMPADEPHTKACAFRTARFPQINVQPLHLGLLIKQTFRQDVPVIHGTKWHQAGHVPSAPADGMERVSVKDASCGWSRGTCESDTTWEPVFLTSALISAVRIFRPVHWCTTTWAQEPIFGRLTH